MSQESLSEPSKYFKEWIADAHSIQNKEIELSINAYFVKLGLVLMEPELKCHKMKRDSVNLLIDKNQLVLTRIAKKLQKGISIN